MKVSSIRKLAPLIGISHTMLNRHYAKGKFKAESDGAFDVKKVRAALAANADMAKPARIREAGAPKKKGVVRRNADSAYRRYNEARAQKESIIAKERELDLRIRQGELVEAADVVNTWSKTLTEFRNRLLLVSDRLAPSLAVSSDVLECRKLIESEMKEVIQTLGEADAA